MSEQELDLPKGWVNIEFKKSINNIPLTGKKLKQKEYLESGKFPVIDQGQDFIGGFTNKEEFLVDCKLPVIIFGDHTKAIKFVNQEFIAGADGVKVLQPKSFFVPKLLFYFTQAMPLPNKGYARHYQYLEKSKIKLPPLNEQKRIVSKIEELFSKIDSTKQSLEQTKLLLEQYRFSLLKSIFEGKEWKKIKIGDNLNFQYGKGLPKKDRKQGKIPVYGSSGIAGYHNKALVETPSLIVGRKGSAGSVYLADQPFWPIDTTYFIEETAIYNLKFLFHLLIHLRLGSIDSSTAIPSLRRDDAYGLEIPLPSLEEQEQIVSQIEQGFSLIENTQNIVNSTLQTLETMKMSVLKQAFEGKLVPQDPNDEPAHLH